MNSLRNAALIFILLLIAPISSAQAQPRRGSVRKDIQITWLGHAAFEIVSAGGTRILIDPFLKENPATPAEFKDLARYHPNFILVTHSHGDHMGDAIEIAKANKAKLVTVNFPSLFQKEGLSEELIQTANVGGTVSLGDLKSARRPGDARERAERASRRVRRGLSRRALGLSSGRHMDFR